MLQDRLAGRKPEIETINGAVVGQGGRPVRPERGHQAPRVAAI